jgi:hypothetical protein
MYSPLRVHVEAVLFELGTCVAPMNAPCCVDMTKCWLLLLHLHPRLGLFEELLNNRLHSLQA